MTETDTHMKLNIRNVFIPVTSFQFLIIICSILVCVSLFVKSGLNCSRLNFFFFKSVTFAPTGGVQKVANSSAVTIVAMLSARSASCATLVGRSSQSSLMNSQSGIATSAGLILSRIWCPNATGSWKNKN